MRRILPGMAGGFLAVLMLIALLGAINRETITQIFEGGIRVANIESLYGGNQTDTTMVIGDASMTSLTVTTNDTGNDQVLMPMNSIGFGREIVGVMSRVIFCGELAENSTTFLGPSTGSMGGNGADLSIGSSACDALDNATEATADAPISTLVTKVIGFRCVTDGTLGASETLTFTLRTAAADVVTTDGAQTTLTCALAAGETECRAIAGSTTNIAASATLAMQATEASNNADDNAWCEVMVSWPFSG